MKKRIVLTMMVALLPIAILSAEVGMSLDIAAQYSSNEVQAISSSGGGSYTRAVAGEHLGGFDLALAYNLTKEWDVFLDLGFSFNKNTFTNDSLLGFGYNFDLKKGFYAFIGGGFAFGGKAPIKDASTTQNMAFVGAGMKADVGYMITKSVGLYTGLTFNMYAAVLNGKFLKKSFVRSLNPKLGLRIKF